METKKKSILHRPIETVAFCLCVLILGYITVNLLLFHQAFFLAAFCVFYVLGPGCVFVSLVCPSLCKDRGWTLLVSAYFGFFLLITQYYLLNWLGCLSLIKILPLLSMLLMSAAWIRKKATNHLRRAHCFTSGKGFFRAASSAGPFIFGLSVFTLYSYGMMIRTVPNHETSVFVDYLYHMGNIATLTRGGVLTDPRIVGIPLRYHYFVELFYAILRNVFPVTIFNCVFRFPVLLSPLLSCGSIYKLLRLKVKRRWFCTAVMLLTLFFADIEPYYTHLTSHIGTNINAVGMGLPAAIAVFYVLWRFSEDLARKEKMGACIVLFGIGICATGLKGPFSMVLTGSCILLFIFLFLRKREEAIRVLPGVAAMALSFFIVWAILLRVAINADNLEPTARFFGLLNFNLVVPKPFWGKMDGGSAVSILIVPYCILYAFGFLTIPFMAFAGRIVYRMIRSQDVDNMDAFLTLTSLLSIACYFFLAVGQNRFYFLMLATPFVAVMAACWCSQAWPTPNVWKRLALVPSVVLLCVSAYNSIKNPMVYYGSGTLTDEDIRATDWLRINTSSDAVLAIDDHAENGKHFYYSALSERQFYIETGLYSMNAGVKDDVLQDRFRLNDELYREENENRRKVAKQMDVDYIIQLDYTGMFSNDLTGDFKEVYTNRNVKIFQYFQE